jgi:hypothetical protein
MFGLARKTVGKSLQKLIKKAAPENSAAAFLL